MTTPRLARYLPVALLGWALAWVCGLLAGARHVEVNRP